MPLTTVDLNLVWTQQAAESSQFICFPRHIMYQIPLAYSDWSTLYIECTFYLCQYLFQEDIFISLVNYTSSKISYRTYSLVRSSINTHQAHVSVLIYLKYLLCIFVFQLCLMEDTLAAILTISQKIVSVLHLLYLEYTVK